MKIKKVISLLLASILLVSLELGIASTETVNPEFPRNYHYERRGALKIQGLA